MTELETLLRAVAADLGDPSGWEAPVEFPDSLALCALNAAFSLRGRSTAAAHVLARYRELRPTAATDSGPDLLQAIKDAGGPEAFTRDVLDNDSKLPGTARLRAVGIHEGLTRLAVPKVGVTTTAQLRAAADNPAVREAWLSVVGFGPLCWSYLLMNAGVTTETKPDEMVQRYLACALGEEHRLAPDRARRLLDAVAKSLGVEPRSLDRAIWLYESRRDASGTR